MKILVCIKQVPNPDASLSVNETGTWVEEKGIGFELNDYDRYGVEAALRIKDANGAEVAILTIGPDRASTAVKNCLAMGGDPSKTPNQACQPSTSEKRTDEAGSPGDPLCVHCGYNLRGLSTDRKCPECGTPIAKSLRGDLLSSADPDWLRRLHRGQLYIVVGIVVFLAWIPAGPLLSLLTLALDPPAYVHEGIKTAHSILSMSTPSWYMSHKGDSSRNFSTALLTFSIA